MFLALFGAGSVMVGKHCFQPSACTCLLMFCITLHVQHTQHDMRRKHDVDIHPATSSTAGLAKLEALADRQAQSLQALARQVTKVQLKTRLVGHDTKPLLRKV